MIKVLVLISFYLIIASLIDLIESLSDLYSVYFDIHQIAWYKTVYSIFVLCLEIVDKFI